MGRLTTHVLDTAQGKPGASIAVTVYRVDGERRRIAERAPDRGDRVGRRKNGCLLGGTHGDGVIQR